MGKKCSKVVNRLAKRISDYDRMMSDTRRPGDGKKELRLESGGYRKPGSSKK